MWKVCDIQPNAAMLDETCKCTVCASAFEITRLSRIGSTLALPAMNLTYTTPHRKRHGETDFGLVILEFVQMSTTTDHTRCYPCPSILIRGRNVRRGRISDHTALMSMVFIDASASAPAPAPRVRSVRSMVWTVQEERCMRKG